MKGFMIYETPLWGDEENVVYLQEVKDASYTLKQVDSDDITCYLEGIAKGGVAKATCNKDDTYDFETGALITLMKKCGVDKVVRACDEAFSEDTFKTYALKHERELNELKKEKEMSVYFGGRQNGKQYTALVEFFKKIDQKKVDAAYKDAYGKWTELPRTLNINGITYLKSFQIIKHNDQLDSLIEGIRAFTRKFDDEWLYKIPTKREEMWEKIFEASRYAPVELKVAKEDITTFLKELQDKIPEVMWNGSDCPPTENIVSYWFKHDYIYFALLRNDDNGKLKLCYNDEHHSWIKTTIDYLPPMRWDLFKKGRLAIKVNYDNYKEFYEACEKELGKKPSTVYTGEYTVSICKKDGLFQVFAVEHQKSTGRKIVNWEDVR